MIFLDTSRNLVDTSRNLVDTSRKLLMASCRKPLFLGHAEKKLFLGAHADDLKKCNEIEAKKNDEDKNQ